MSENEQAAWREGRRHAAAEHAAALQRRKAAESEQARALIERFVAEARARGLRTTELRARSYSGRTTYRTGVTGWYLRRDRSLGVGEDGSFYVLSVPGSLADRFRGARLTPEDPPLAVGAGARDGESMALDALLRLRLESGDDWA